MDLKAVGIFSRKVPLDYLLREGDRIEIYRPLKADPQRNAQAASFERINNPQIAVIISLRIAGSIAQPSISGPDKPSSGV